MSDNHTFPENHKYFGLLFALSSSFFIGSYWVVNKYSLTEISIKKTKQKIEQAKLVPPKINVDPSDDTLKKSRKSSGGSSVDNNHNNNSNLKFEFLWSKNWWLGILLMSFGEICNFIAYIFSPAILVTPLGALSIVVTSILSRIFLKEEISTLKIFGMILAIIGSFLISIYAPTTSINNNFNQILNQNVLGRSSSLAYFITVIIFMSILWFFILDNNNNNNNSNKINITIKNFNGLWILRIIYASFAGSFVVIITKLIGAGLVQIFEAENRNDEIFQHLHWAFFILPILIAVCISTEMVQIARALYKANASIVMPTFYISFTTITVFSTTFLFMEAGGSSYYDMVVLLCGFLLLCISVLFLHSQ